MGSYLPILMQMYLANSENAYYSLSIMPDENDDKNYICTFTQAGRASELYLSTASLITYITQLQKSFAFASQKATRLVAQIPGFPTVCCDLANVVERNELYTLIEQQIKLLETLDDWPVAAAK